ncbi:MAG: IS630 family transposase [Candidatus Methylacidiphilales bacterium]
MQLKRRKWRDKRRRWKIRRLVFLDETAAKTNMTRLRGRAPRGKRCYATTPHGHWYTNTMIASPRSDGTTTYDMVEGATTREVFRNYVRDHLAPTLRRGDLVVLDNLAGHKDPEALRLIAQAGARVHFLPPYSPDLNPIEKMWSKVKALLRKAKARTLCALRDAVRNAFNSITSRDATGWFASCGYTFT